MNLTWKDFTGLYLGGAFCLPLLLIGFQAGSRHGLGGAMLAILAGNALLTALALFTSRLGVTTRMTMAELAEERLGARGGKIFAGAILLIHILWFALQLDLISSYGGYCLLGALSAVSVFVGLKKLSLIANLSLPILIGALLYSMLLAPVPQIGFEGTGIMKSLAIFTAAGLAAALEMPTYFRKARSVADSRIASILIFGLGVPLIEGGGAYLGASMPQGQLLPILESGLSWTPLFLVIAGVTTNNNNLYAATVYGERFFGKMAMPLLAIVGILLATAKPGIHIQGILPLMALPLGSIGGVILGRGSLFSFGVGLLCGIFGPLGSFVGSFIFSLGEQRVKLKQY